MDKAWIFLQISVFGDFSPEVVLPGLELATSGTGGRRGNKEVLECLRCWGVRFYSLAAVTLARPPCLFSSCSS